MHFFILNFIKLRKSKYPNFTSNLMTYEPTEIGKMTFTPMRVTKNEDKTLRTKKKNLAVLPYFTPEDALAPIWNNLIRDMFFSFFKISFLRGQWVTYGQGAAERIEPIRFYYNFSCYPTIETMVKYANLQLKRLKEEQTPQASGASSCSVCTPVAATSTGATSLATEDAAPVESIKSIFESAECLLEEIQALTAEIKKGLGPNSSC
jgi:hypothetical protein